jgi:hypothetical protein
MAAHSISAPWWCAVLVGSIAPGVVGATVHLVVLLVRPTPAPTAERETREIDPGDDAPEDGDDEDDGRDDTLDERGVSLLWETAPPAGDQPGDEAGDEVADRAAALIDEGAGRRRLARELQISEHQARELIASRNGKAVAR